MKENLLTTESITMVDDKALTMPLDCEEMAPLTPCPACGFYARNRDRFCRRCGVHRHSGRVAVENSPYATSTFAREDFERRVSGSLAKALVESAASSGLSRCSNAAVRNLALALISIPLWLIVVLLSPLDTLAIVREASARIVH